MKRLLTLISMLAIIQTIGTSAGAGNKLDQAVLALEADIKKASSQLTELRKRHSAERIMLSRRIAELESGIIPLREKRQELKDIIWMKETGYQQLQARAGSLKEEVSFCASLLSEYYREMTVRMTLAEENHLKETRPEIDRVLRAESSETVLEGIQPMLDMISHQNQVNLGGTVFKGQALDKNGLLYSGTFVRAGPIDFFVDDKGKTAGLTGLNPGSAIPQIILGLNAENLQDLALGREAEVLLDFTLGEAIKVKQHNPCRTGYRQCSGFYSSRRYSAGRERSPESGSADCAGFGRRRTPL
jgi:cell division protein FtsB